MTNPTPALAEIATMTRIVKALDALDIGAQIRVVAWVWERYMGVPHEGPARSDHG